MTDVIFKDDPSSRKVMRSLLLLQITAMMIVIGLILFESYSLALTISLLTFIVFIASVLWLYLRYQKIPLVREKADVQQRLLTAQNKIRTEVNNIQSARRKRESLYQAEKDEMSATLKKSQEDYIANGLASSSLKHAAITGVGPKLKERLAVYGVVSAATIGNNLSRIPGFGQAKRQALITWRSAVMAKLDSTKPISLTNEQFEYITQTYQALRQLNDTTEKNAQEAKRAAEYELNSLAPRLKQLAPITFVAYASRSLASRGMAAALIAVVLIVAQLVSSVGAATSSLIASIPTATPTGTATLTPTNTFTLTITLTPTITDTPTQTFTPPATATPLPALTSLPPPTLVVIVPAQPAQVACSCSGDTLNCGNFLYQSSAQSCYNYCISVGAGDIHGLDGNHDGVACESLP